jgi:hypothetical protein
MSLLEERLTKEWAQELMSDEKRLISAIIHDLQEKGSEIAGELKLKDYSSPGEFHAEHDRGGSPFCVLEGKADRKGDVYVLKGCPMAKLVESMKGEDGKLPKFYLKIGDKYKEIYKSKGAILHPFCIVHQVIRAMVGERIKVGGKPVKVYQVACRALKSGKTAYASEGMDRTGLGKDEVDAMIDGSACMYMSKL